MSRWEMITLGDIAPTRPSKKEFLNDEAVWDITLDQIESNTGKIVNKRISKVSDAPQSSNFVDEDNVLYSKLRPYLNKVIIPNEKGFATTELVPLFPDKKRIDKRFLLHFLMSPGFVSWATNTVAGAKMPRLTMSEFWKHHIPLPPLPEQQRIVARLDKAQQLIDQRKEQIALMDALVQSLFYEMFGDPVKNEKGWEIRQLKECIIGKAANGFFAKNHEYSQDGSIGVVWLGDFINKFYCDYSNLRKINPTARDIQQHSISYGDILFCRSSLTVDGIGKASCVPHTPSPTMYECHIIRVTLNQEILLPEFFKVLSDTNFFRGQVMRHAKTSTMTTIGQDGIVSCSVIIPPISLQQSFLGHLQQIDALKQQMQASLVELELNFHALMQEVFGQ